MSPRMSASTSNWVLQALAIAAMNLRSLRQRAGASAAAVVGVAGVVGVLVAVLSIGEGFRSTLATTGSEDTAIVLRAGSDSEMMSVLSREETRLIADAPGIARGADGTPLASAELFVVVDLPKRSTGTLANVPLRGVQAAAFPVRGNIRIVEGRSFAPGRSEILVGSGAAAQFSGLEVGKTVRWGENEWTVVGRFTAAGTLAESELWCDAGVLQPAYRRGTSFQAVYAKLAGPEAFAAFKDALTRDPRLDVRVQRETEYFAKQSEILVKIITILGSLVAGLMAIGAVFGALNTMYSAVAARSREIATLRAIGFGAAPVVASVMAEALLLSLSGGLVGALGAWLVFDGYRTSTLNMQSFSQVTFAFAVTPALLAQGIVWALAMGFVGGLFPAIRASRLGVATALREL